LSKNIKIKIYRILILLDVLYGCKTCSLTLRKERTLRVFENSVLRRLSIGLKREEVIVKWRRLPDEELNDSYCSNNIIRVIKSRRWVEHVARIGERRSAYRKRDHVEDSGVD
jgi:hypothetical protein